jgi:ribonuclease-3
MADVVESLMAAIYLDAGSEAARGFLHRHWPLNSRADAQNGKDATSKLQEWSLQHGLGLPAYRQLAKIWP